MKALWICAVVLASAATLSATQFSYSNKAGTVSQTTTLTITGATLSNPAGTLSMSCPSTSHASIPSQRSGLAAATPCRLSLQTARPRVTGAFSPARLKAQF
jgi:hypothetical protein